MSNHQYAFLERTRVPDRAALRASIEVLGFDHGLHPDCAPIKDAGFLPFVLEGEQGPGVEIGCRPSGEPPATPDEPLAGARDALVDTRRERERPSTTPSPSTAPGVGRPWWKVW